MRREPFPINPRYLITGLTKFRLRPISLLVIFLALLGIGPSLFLPLVGNTIAGIGAGLLVPMEGRLCGWIELLDPGDAPGDLPGRVDLVLGVTGGFVDESRSEGRVSSESECAAIHRGMVVETYKDGVTVICMCM